MAASQIALAAATGRNLWINECIGIIAQLTPELDEMAAH
jgi:hypothetical protein